VLKQKLCIVIVIGILLVISLGCSGFLTPIGWKAQEKKDEVGDVEIDFIDIEEGSVEISHSIISCKITLRNIPQQLKFNNPKVGINSLEYSWGVEFDVNKDGSADYGLSISHFHDGGPEKIGDILSNTQKNVWKIVGHSGTFVTSIDASIEGNTIVLKAEKSKSPDLANITDKSKASFHTWYNNGGSRYSDELR